MTNSLTKSERPILEELEKRIERGLQEFFDVGSALIQIRDQKLHRETHDDFKLYCADRFKIGKTRAYQLIAAAEVVSDLQKSTIVDFSNGHSLANSIKTESQARELAKVEPARRATVLKAVIATGSVTAAAIKAEVRKPAIQEAEIVHLDKALSRPVPPKIVELWDRAALEGAEMLKLLSAVRCAFRKAQEDDDRAFAELNLSGSIAKLDAIYSDTKSIMPYAVCSTCQGMNPSKCTFCKGRGFISEFYWKTHVPKETKELIAKGIKK